MPDAIGIVEAWLGSVLPGDATLSSLAPGGVHSGQAPEGAGWPYVVFGEWTSRNNTTVDGEIQIAHVEFDAIAMSKGDDSSVVVENILTRVKQLIHKQSGEGNGGRVYGCIQMSSDRDAYSANDTTYRVQADHYRAVVR